MIIESYVYMYVLSYVFNMTILYLLIWNVISQFFVAKLCKFYSGKIRCLIIYTKDYSYFTEFILC